MNENATLEVRCECGEAFNITGKDVLKDVIPLGMDAILYWYAICPHCKKKVEIGQDMILALIMQDFYR